jgi:hypothetical protein
MASITEAPPAKWSAEELEAYKADYPRDTTYKAAFSTSNPTPGAPPLRPWRVLQAAVHAPPAPPPVPALHTLARARCCLLPDCRHRAHGVPARAAQQLPLLQRGGGVHPRGAGRWWPAFRCAAAAIQLRVYQQPSPMRACTHTGCAMHPSTHGGMRALHARVRNVSTSGRTR